LASVSSLTFDMFSLVRDGAIRFRIEGAHFGQCCGERKGDAEPPMRTSDQVGPAGRR